MAIRLFVSPKARSRWISASGKSCFNCRAERRVISS
jgi:hypothetical protein